MKWFNGIRVFVHDADALTSVDFPDSTGWFVDETTNTLSVRGYVQEQLTSLATFREWVGVVRIKDEA